MQDSLSRHHNQFANLAVVPNADLNVCEILLELVLKLNIILIAKNSRRIRKRYRPLRSSIHYETIRSQNHGRGRGLLLTSEIWFDGMNQCWYEFIVDLKQF